MNDFKAKVGPGAFQWNGGSWFGSLFGCTAYLLIGGFSFFIRHPTLSLIWLACFLVGLIFGWYLWTCRETLEPYSAIQRLILGTGFCSTIAISAAVVLAPQALAAVNLTPGTSLGLLVLIPIIMFRFHLMEKGSRRKQKAISQPPLEHRKA